MRGKICVALSLALGFMLSCKTSTSKVSETDLNASKGLLSLNDISILIPLHLVPAFRDPLPHLTGKGEQEAFAPSWLGQDIARIQNEETEARAKLRPFDFNGTIPKLSENFDAFRLVAVRIDPCANIRTAKATPEGCIPQLRIVWQRLFNTAPRDTATATEAGPFSRAEDAAVHTVYQLSPADLQSILSQLREMHKNASVDTRGLPLQVHPVLAKEGIESPYFKGLLAIVGRFARASQMTHVSHFSAISNGNVWQMTLFEIKDGQALRHEIPATLPRTDKGSMQVQTLRREPNDRNLIVSPMTSSPFVLFEPIDFRADDATREAQEESMDRRMIANIAAIENPTLHDATNIDCGSCHRALGTFAFAQDREMKKKGKLETPPLAYQSKTQNLSFTVNPFLLDFTGPWSLQMFSYFGSQPKITPRVINETAEALDFLDRP